MRTRQEYEEEILMAMDQGRHGFAEYLANRADRAYPLDNETDERPAK